jgi:TRAP-type C4-dicarboxylate transport system permease small subunit
MLSDVLDPRSGRIEHLSFMLNEVSIMKPLKRIVSSLSVLGLWISGIAVLFMILLITVEVVGRRVLNFSTLIADEFSGYLLVVITFMGAAYTLKTGGFTRMELVYNQFKSKGRWISDFVFNLISLVFLIILDYWLWVHIISDYRTDMASISILQTPLYLPKLFMGLGATLLLIEVLLEIVTLFSPQETKNKGGI